MCLLSAVANAVEFLGGVRKAADVGTLDLGILPRLVFAGRSNVGKSSLLNSLTRAKLARVSSTPGKTREINFFRWMSHGKPLILVDLPGYGYAKVSASLRSDWGVEIAKWLEQDPHLSLVVSLVDGRHGFMPQDLELLEFLSSRRIPFLVAFTKMDKWKSNNQRKQAERTLNQSAMAAGVENFIFVSSMVPDGTAPLKRILKSILL